MGVFEYAGRRTAYNPGGVETVNGIVMFPIVLTLASYG